MLKEFKEFAMRGNVMDLAVGVIIGVAFGKIINSLVSDIIMPLINPLIVAGDWKSMEIGPGVKIGNFLATTLDFIIITLAIFFIVKIINSMKKKEEAKPVGPAELPPDVKLLAEIRDLLRSKTI